jgi:glycerol-3-phosphate acyltransferase PlsX
MIAVDAMGGDLAPDVVVQGAISASRSGIPVLLCGDKSIIQRLLSKYDSSWKRLPISIEHCADMIGMDEAPSKSVVQKTDSSIVRAMHAVASGRAHAVVSAGNSGAVLVASTLILGRLPEVSRPAIGGFIPTRHGGIFCLDLGANIDCKPEHLVQFAIMGHAYVSAVKNVVAPRIALLSNGHEPYKGSELVKKVYEQLAGLDINFVGNLEARDMFDNRADVLVCDGFVGNVMLKTAEGTIRATRDWLTQYVKELPWWRRLLAGMGTHIFKNMYAQLDYARTGGALLLGVKKPVVVAHGCSSAHAIDQAIRFAARVVDQDIVTHFAARLQECSDKAFRNQGIVAKVRSLFGKWVQQ